MGFSCRCGEVYCSKHRLPEEHGCTFDHQMAGRRKLTEDNPQVIAEKLTKI
jgi:predicted nucleic acid binding AN1-type Zn finger protein